MSALVLEQRAVPRLRASGVRKLLAHLAQALDRLVSARAAREVPEWRMREVQAEIARYCNSFTSKNEPRD
jgi:hypothetical protein